MHIEGIWGNVQHDVVAKMATGAWRKGIHGEVLANWAVRQGSIGL